MAIQQFGVTRSELERHHQRQRRTTGTAVSHTICKRRTISEWRLTTDVWHHVISIGDTIIIIIKIKKVGNRVTIAIATRRRAGTDMFGAFNPIPHAITIGIRSKRRRIIFCGAIGRRELDFNQIRQSIAISIFEVGIGADLYFLEVV